MTEPITQVRHKAIAVIALFSLAHVLTLSGLVIWSSHYAIPALILSAMLSTLPVYALLKLRTDRSMRLALGLATVLQPSLLIYAAQGNVWQLDLHLYFVVGLILLTALCDARVIAIACLVGALHHALLGLLAPHWVFAGGSGLWRVLIHFAAFAAAALVLCAIAAALRDAFVRLEDLGQRADNLAAQVRDGEAALTHALAQIELERKRNVEASIEADVARKGTFEAMAAEFEIAVNAVIQSVVGTGHVLEQSAQALKRSAATAGEEARQVVGAAETASKAANVVAAGVAELSMAINEIAYNVGQQSELTDHATQRADGGGKAICSLSQQSRTIGEATRAIVRIAERTNLLSLNAAIEAASAGASGRGFNIVATEVKLLASQASEAAIEIEAFLKGVRSGTLEAERSFQAIDAAIAKVGKNANSIRYDVENQRQSADTIESFARDAAVGTDAMVGQIRALAESAGSAGRLSDDLDRAAALLAQDVRKLEASADRFASRLRAC